MLTPWGSPARPLDTGGNPKCISFTLKHFQTTPISEILGYTYLQELKLVFGQTGNRGGRKMDGQTEVEDEIVI